MSNEAVFEELVTLLSSGISRAKLYFSTHPRVREVSDTFSQGLAQVLAETGKDKIFLGMVEGKLVHEGRYLIGPTIVGGRLVDFLVNLGSGGLLFRTEMEGKEVAELLRLAAEISEPVESLDEARELLVSHGVEHIEVSPPYEDKGWFGQFFYEGNEYWGTLLESDDGTEGQLPLCQDLFGRVEDMHSAATGDQTLDLAGTRSSVEKLVQSTEDGAMGVMRLVRYPDYDSYTVGHSVRVALIAVITGKHLGMENHVLMDFATAALLHDIGKAKVSEDILFKSGRLTGEERRHIRCHPVQGAQILLDNRLDGQLAVSAAWGHHLRYDGGGYPESARWTVRSRLTSLLQVCDVFEALTSVRPYREAFTPRRAYEMMLQDEGAFFPGALSTLAKAVGLYPPGSRVRLSNGQRGVVRAVGPQFDRPRVHVTHDVSGLPLAPADSVVLDLSSEHLTGVSVACLLADL